MNKILIIVRHAHRDTSLKEADNGLSGRGKAQAKNLAKFLAKHCENEIPHFWSSPKKRCRETLTPLAEKLGREIEIHACLNEAQRVEDLVAQCEKFHGLWKKSPHPLLIICSHGDWIPEYLNSVLGLPIELAKGAWAQLELGTRAARPQLTWLVQDLDFF